MLSFLTAVLISQATYPDNIVVQPMELHDLGYIGQIYSLIREDGSNVIMAYWNLTKNHQGCEGTIKIVYNKNRGYMSYWKVTNPLPGYRCNRGKYSVGNSWKQKMDFSNKPDDD